MGNSALLETTRNQLRHFLVLMRTDLRLQSYDRDAYHVTRRARVPPIPQDARSPCGAKQMSSVADYLSPRPRGCPVGPHDSITPGCCPVLRIGEAVGEHVEHSLNSSGTHVAIKDQSRTHHPEGTGH